VGCPGESALRRAVFGGLKDNPDLDAVTEHAHKCGPCTQQIAVLVKEKARERSAA
jgi:bacterioferritin-associated ferredoxin